jgi:hypothetical protein
VTFAIDVRCGDGATGGGSTELRDCGDDRRVRLAGRGWLARFDDRLRCHTAHLCGVKYHLPSLRSIARTVHSFAVGLWAHRRATSSGARRLGDRDGARDYRGDDESNLIERISRAKIR